MTTRDLHPGLPAATPAHRTARGALRSLLLLALLAPAAAWAAPAPEPAPVVPEVLAVNEPVAVADPAPARPPSTTQPAAAPTAPPANPGLKQRADAAANATLAALLPHLAGSDSLPLLDRSAMFAGDVSRLLAAYDLTQGAASQAPATADGAVQQVLKAAMSLIGTPYRWGGTTTDGFDCSGLVGYVFRNTLGIELPRVSREMAAKDDAELIRDRALLTPGDLVFFGLRGRVNHVGIYVGGGQFLHAPSRGKDVRVDSLASGYWSNRFMQARRVTM